MDNDKIIDFDLKIRDGIVVYDLEGQGCVVYTDKSQAAEHVGRSRDGLARALDRMSFYYVGNFMVSKASVIGSRRRGSKLNKKLDKFKDGGGNV